MELTDEPPWTGSQLKRLGRAIRESREREATEISYDEVVMWYGDLAVAVEDCIKRMEFSPILSQRRPEVSSRPKTIHTLRDKLVATPSLQLPSIVDIAGVRVEAAMDLDDQGELAKLIAIELGQEFDKVISDTRHSPHSGYRALHIRAKMPAGRVEIQIRTALQGAWANLFEALADHLGRYIRYGNLPTDRKEREQVERALKISERLAVVEDRKKLLRDRRLETDKSYQILEDSIHHLLGLTPAEDYINRNVYLAKLEKCKIDWDVEHREWKANDSSNAQNDLMIVRQLKSLESDIRNMRKKGE
ncbi:hypothetical protein [Nocardia sp. NPDC049149]|uniref:hypothetical protein n=1 Tax=Nocardia sp. NPDC049149 TaxID=3364315 RepID=UPI00371FCC84